ncbi:MAG: PaaI family thioesterase [Albidovulum sp.]
MKPVMSEAEISTFLAREFPQLAAEYHLEGLTDTGLIMRLRVSDKHLRPGGTVSGPTIFGLADFAFYFALLSRIGPVALAVTTSAAVDFMRRPRPDADLLANVRLLKVGRVLAVGDVMVHSEGQGDAVARISMTYSIPPNAEDSWGILIPFL